MRNLREKGALRRAETQKWPNRLKPFFSDEPNISRFDASDYAGVAGYGGQQPKSVFSDFGQLLGCSNSRKPEFGMAHTRVCARG